MVIILFEKYKQTANSDLAAEFEKDLMDDDDPPMPSSSAASSGSAFGYGKSSFHKQTGGKPRFGNSVLARNSVGSGSGSRSRPSSVVGTAPRQAPHSRAVIHNSGFENKISHSMFRFTISQQLFEPFREHEILFKIFFCRYAESPDHSRSRSRTRSHSEVAQYVLFSIVSYFGVSEEDEQTEKEKAHINREKEETEVEKVQQDELRCGGPYRGNQFYRAEVRLSARSRLVSVGA